MRFCSVAVIVGCIFVAACASDPENMGEDPATNQLTIETPNEGESQRARTERRLQLERSIDQWWFAKQQQEYGKSDGIAAALEKYVDENFAEVAEDLQTASPRFRKVAAAALGFSDRQESIASLETGLRDPFAEVVFASLLSLWNLSIKGFPINTAAIVPYLSHSDTGIRSNASLVLAQATKPGQGELFLPLTTAMEDAEPSVRVHASAALGRLGDPDAIPFLVKGLQDPKPLVRLRAAYALGRIGDRRAVPPLIDHIEDPQEDVAKAVHKALKVITGQNLPRLKRDWIAYWDRQIVER